jgi:hypothetical protein
MTTQIPIKESITDKESNFNIKIFKLGGLNIDAPTKVIDSKKVNYDFFKTQENEFKNILFETSKKLSNSSIQNVISSKSDAIIKQAFGYLNWIDNYENLISLTLDFNPFSEYSNLDEDLSGFFDYYYEFSKTALLVPNIKATQNIYRVDTKNRFQKIGEQPLININQYLDFVDDIYRLLGFKNKKPIFVPLSLKFDIGDTAQLAKEYLKRDYFNIWIDFEGATATNKTKLAKIRSFLREVDNQKRSDDIIIHSTNIRREITSNIKNTRSPASDVLTSLSGANVIGVNREPAFPQENPPPYEELMRIREHKARIFENETYYYKKIENPDNLANLKLKPLLNPNNNAVYNANLLNQEFVNQSNEFLERQSIKEYISNKKMLLEYKDGDLINTLFFNKSIKLQKTLDPWFVDI